MPKATITVMRVGHRDSDAGKRAPSELLIVTPQGIGDALIAATVGYHCEAAGIATAIRREIRGEAAVRGWSVSDFDVSELELLPLLSGSGRGEVFRLAGRRSFAWHDASGGAMLDRLLAEIGLERQAAPATAMIGADIERMEIGGGHGIIAPWKHSAPEYSMSKEQVAAAAAEMRAAGLIPVVVHSERVDLGGVDAVNWTGQTRTVRELLPLLAAARVVVTADNGILHAAQAMQVPTVAVASRRTIAPEAFRDYAPILWCMARGETRAVRERTIMLAVRAMLKASEARWCIAGPERYLCGVEQAGRRVARAAGVFYARMDADAIAEADAVIVEYHPYYHDDWAAVFEELRARGWQGEIIWSVHKAADLTREGRQAEIAELEVVGEHGG
ncbi:MAG: hypothetical protein JRD89_00275 [Deltaproteobacteria bacterium]|nr:hypothetical protein [Deltaproteobacteria bacterium]